MRLADYEREKAYLQRSVDQTAAEIGVLSEQESKEEQGTEADADELKRASDLYSRGTLTSTRVTDARRAVLLSSTRKLQITAQLMQVRKQQDDFARQLQRLDDQRKIKLLQELQDANVKLAQTRAKLEGVREKLEYSAQVRSQLTRAASGSPQITVMRKSEKGWGRTSANEDFELAAGRCGRDRLAFRSGRRVGDAPRQERGKGFTVKTPPCALAASVGLRVLTHDLRNSLHVSCAPSSFGRRDRWRGLAARKASSAASPRSPRRASSRSSEWRR